MLVSESPISGPSRNPRKGWSLGISQYDALWLRHSTNYPGVTERILFSRGSVMPRFIPLSFGVALLTSACGSVMAQQFADPEFDAKVDRPAFTNAHPLVLLDEAHNNFHTTFGRYKPFVDLLKNDGYNVSANKEKLTAKALTGCSILVVANAMGAPIMRSPDAAKPAFEEAECDAVYTWIQAGGSLLLIADHHPWGASNDQLAKRLGVEMGKSTTFDPANGESGLPAAIELHAREQTAR